MKTLLLSLSQMLKSFKKLYKRKIQKNLTPNESENEKKATTMYLNSLENLAWQILNYDNNMNDM
jgi:hypothetical protein